MSKTIFTHISQLVTPLGNREKHGKNMSQFLKLKDAAIVVENGFISAVGTTAEIMEKENEACEIRNLEGHAVLPGFVDSHTHFIFGGYRPEEFMMRLQGVPYIEIHKAGGGIQNTVEATRKLTFQEMYELGKIRLKDALSMGVTTIEGKSGYGLDQECELMQLEVMKKLNQDQPASVVSTYLGAHSIPTEYKNNPEAYIDRMIEKMLPYIKEKDLAEFVDVFCENGVFSTVQSERLLRAAKKLGFQVKIHADEIASTGGAELAADLDGISADHLLMISEEGIQKLAKSRTTATLLPCTAFCLNKPYAPARKMIDAGCAVALASDYNPGSCFTNSVPLMFALAVMHMGMTLDEAVCALTLNGAAALGLADCIGSIEQGKKADFVILETPSYEYLVYHTCKNLVKEVIKEGKTVYTREDILWK